MAMHRAPLHCLLCLLCLVLAGCAGMQEASTAEADKADSPFAADVRAEQPVHEEVRKAATILVEGIRLYESGNFKEAILVLGKPELQAAPDAMRLEALKYAAFSYCVTEDYAQCRHAFDLSLDIDAGFELRSTEHGHPMWGPVFDQARAEHRQHGTGAALDRDRERWRGIDLWRAR